MERLPDFIKTNHGSQDWENGVYNLQDYLAAFIGAREKEVYQDLKDERKIKIFRSYWLTFSSLDVMCQPHFFLHPLLSE
jgi:hypothetical protein